MQHSLCSCLLPCPLHPQCSRRVMLIRNLINIQGPVVPIRPWHTAGLGPSIHTAPPAAKCLVATAEHRREQRMCSHSQPGQQAGTKGPGDPGLSHLREAGSLQAAGARPTHHCMTWEGGAGACVRAFLGACRALLGTGTSCSESPALQEDEISLQFTEQELQRQPGNRIFCQTACGRGVEDF